MDLSWQDLCDKVYKVPVSGLRLKTVEDGLLQSLCEVVPEAVPHLVGTCILEQEMLAIK